MIKIQKQTAFHAAGQKELIATDEHRKNTVKSCADVQLFYRQKIKEEKNLLKRIHLYIQMYREQIQAKRRLDKSGSLFVKTTA